MHRYENPTAEDVRRENIEQFGIGGKRKREDTEDKALTTLPNERATKTQAATPLCDDWLADDMLQMPLDELFASYGRHTTSCKAKVWLLRIDLMIGQELLFSDRNSIRKYMSICVKVKIRKTQNFTQFIFKMVDFATLL